MMKHIKNLIKNIKNLFASNQMKEAALNQLQKVPNPYLQSRLEWNYLFGDIMKAKSQWRWIACFSLLTNAVLVIGLVTLSLKSQFIPYAIKVDQLGNALYAGFLDQEKTILPIEVNAFLRQYIQQARSVLMDSFAQKRAIDFVYSVSLPEVRKTLDDYYRTQNPFMLAKQEMVEVQIQSVIQKSTHTWQVDWLEVHRNQDGQVLHQAHFEALITITHLTVKNAELLNTNPLGLFIQHINWAEEA